MTPVQPNQTVRQLTIAALLGTVPAFAVAQGPRAPTSSITAATNEPADPVADRVAVAARDIPRGTTLAAADIGYTSRRVATERSARPAAPVTVEPAAADDRLVGWTTRRVITAGEALRHPAVGAPQIVKSGDMVEVVWGQDGLLVTMRGRATRSAAVGERIAVRMDSQRKLEGTVIAAGRVRVN